MLSILAYKVGLLFATISIEQEFFAWAKHSKTAQLCKLQIVVSHSLQIQIG